MTRTYPSWHVGRTGKNGKPVEPWDVEELFDVLGERKFEELLAINRADPWGDERADYRMARATALAGREGAETVFWDTSIDAMTPIAPQQSVPQPQQSLEDLKRVLRMYGLPVRGDKPKE